jgi:hypothetical protein
VGGKEDLVRPQRGGQFHSHLTAAAIASNSLYTRPGENASGRSEATCWQAAVGGKEDLVRWPHRRRQLHGHRISLSGLELTLATGQPVQGVENFVLYYSNLRTVAKPFEDLRSVSLYLLKMHWTENDMRKHFSGLYELCVTFNITFLRTVKRL